MKVIFSFLLISFCSITFGQDSSRIAFSFGPSLFYLAPTKSNEVLSHNVIRGGIGGLIQKRLKKDLFLNIKIDGVLPFKPMKDSAKPFLVGQVGITKSIHRSRLSGFLGTGIGNFMVSTDYTYVLKNRNELSTGILYSFNGIVGCYVSSRLDLSDLFYKIYGY